MAETALITGASSGIGEEFARQLADRGYELILVARRKERLERLADSLPTGAKVIARDLATEAAKLPADVRRRRAQVDLLVNNAGFGTRGFFAELPVEREEAEIRLNALAPVCLARAALPGMLERRRGGILNVSSMAGLQPLPGWATYAATKAFLTTFSQSLHEEVRAHGVSVLALMPGFTRTEFHDHASMARSYVPGALWMTADDVARSALRALQRGRAAHVPGWYYQAVALLARMAPWSVSRRIVHAADRRIPTG